MAFANIRNVGLGGGLHLIVGDFTATLGAADQTYAIGAGRILLVHVNPQLTDDPVDYSNSLYSVSTSNGIATLTIYTQAAITGGTFVVLADVGGC